MAYKLVCIADFHGVKKGEKIIDPFEISRHSEKREHHFVRVALTPEEAEEVAHIVADRAETSPET